VVHLEYLVALYQLDEKRGLLYMVHEEAMVAYLRYYYPSAGLEGLRKITNKLSHDRKYICWNL